MNSHTTILRLHIERLTLDGMSPADGRRIVEAVERKLTALVNAAPQSLAVRDLTLHRLDAGSVANGSPADDIGNHLAGKIFQGMGGPRHG